MAADYATAFDVHRPQGLEQRSKLGRCRALGSAAAAVGAAAAIERARFGRCNIACIYISGVLPLASSSFHDSLAADARCGRGEIHFTA